MTRNCVQVVLSLLAADHQRYSSVGYPCMFASTTSSIYSHSTATCSNATKRTLEMPHPIPKRCSSRSRPRSRRSSEYIDCLMAHFGGTSPGALSGFSCLTRSHTHRCMYLSIVYRLIYWLKHHITTLCLTVNFRFLIRHLYLLPYILSSICLISMILNVN